jgi:epoxyqueuosine reductase QueG
LDDSLLQGWLQRVAKEQGADLFGIADLNPALDFICKQGGEHLRRFPRAISIGIRLSDAIVNELHRHGDPAAILPYEAEYFSVNARLDNAASLLAGIIQERGYLAYPIPASEYLDAKKLEGGISHKLVANLAGLGWIGKSCLLVTRDYGPRLRLSTVLTDAPLESGAPMNMSCNDCVACVRICPAKAFTGAPFDPLEPREARFAAHSCESYLNERQGRLGEEGLCGLCVYICPYGRTNSLNVSDTRIS